MNIKRKLARLLPTSLFLRIQYYRVFSKKINLKKPQLFSEKLQWLKLHDKNPYYTKVVDKYSVRYEVEKQLGSDYLIPLIGVWSNVDDIDINNLPEKFVLKTTHNSGSVFICLNKKHFDWNNVKQELRRALQENYYNRSREWPYKNIESKIIAEEYIGDHFGIIDDYKFFCFDGYVDSVMVCVDRQSGNPKFYFFDNNWNFLKLNSISLQVEDGFSIEKPENMDTMFAIASKLSKGFPHVRIDLYNVNGRIYFGEYTLYNSSGFDTNLLPSTEISWGNLIDLEDKNEKYWFSKK